MAPAAPAGRAAAPRGMRLERQRAFLRQPRVAILAWTDVSGEPMQTPVWYRHDDGRFLIYTKLSTAKGRAIQERDRVSLCIANTSPPYSYVTVRGRATIIYGEDAALRLAEEQARRYYGKLATSYFLKEIKKGQGEHVIIEITPTKIASLDSQEIISQGITNRWLLAAWSLLRRLPGL